MDDMPTVSVVTDGYGERMYCVEWNGLKTFHRQAWQAEALMQQLAATNNVELPDKWYCNQLGFRSRPI